MDTTDLVDRAELTATELGQTARQQLDEAEAAARRAAEAAQEAAEATAAWLAELSDRAQHAAATLRDEAIELREDVEDLWDDPTGRRYLLAALTGVGLGLLLVWWLRRRRARAAQDELG